MRRERTTLLGTPTVIAPGAIFLVGGLGLPEEEVAVLAALSSHATAQYFPNVVPLSPLVADVVERAKTILGEAAAALPDGSVLLTPAKPHADQKETSFDTAPATAVATAAAVFELAGQPISERKFEILAVAQAAHRATQGAVDAEGELAAALHGGLIKVMSRPNGASRIERLSPPPGLRVVVFQTGQGLFPTGWLAAVQEFAARDRVGYARIVEHLLEQAGHFSSKLSHRDATAAIASAGRYGHCIARLAAAASAPLQSEAFARATRLAEEIGGIANPTHAGNGDLGIALFATPEAATLFAHACQPPLTPLNFDLDCEGVRVVPISEAGESSAVRTPAPQADAPPAPAEAIVLSQVEDFTTEKRVTEPEDLAAPTSQNGIFPNEEPTVARATPLEELTLPDERLPQPPRKRSGGRLLIGAAMLTAAFLAVWLARPVAHLPAATVHERPSAGGASLAPPKTPEPNVAPAEPVAAPARARPDGPPPAVKPPAAPARSHASASHKASSRRRLAAARPAPVAPAASPKPAAASGEAPKPPSQPAAKPASATRAGKLSSDDF